MSSQAALGILGGTFDPIHRAHLQLAHEALAALGLDAVVLIPAGRPPHRVQPHTAACHRVAMARLAVGDDPRLRVDDSEAVSEEPSYTVRTLQRLRASYGAARPLVLLLGADAFRGLASWYHWQELFTLAHIGVANRPGHAVTPHTLPDELRTACVGRWQSDPARLSATPAGSIVTFNMPPLDISATAARARLARGEQPADLLPPAVLDYIGTNRLYSET